jgi:DNA-binding IclR family transcriptional regulator
MSDAIQKEAGTQTLDRAMELLRIICEAPAALRMTELVARCGLSIATTHRLLTGLALHGIVSQVPCSKRYMLGVHMFALASRAREAGGLTAIARSSVLRLASATGDCVFLMARSGFDAVCIDRQDGAYTIRTLTGGIGGTTPLGYGEGSLVILAHLPKEERAIVLAHNRARIAQRGGTPPSMAMLDRICREGFVYDPMPIIAGGVGVAVPIRTARGLPLASLGVGGTEARIGRDRFPEVLALLRQEVKLIEDAVKENRGMLAIR